MIMFLRTLCIALSILVLSTPLYAQFWEVTSGPPATSTALASNSKGHVFVGTTASAVYKSTDDGSNWVRKDQGIDDGGPNFYPVNTIKVGANDQLFAGVNGLGLVRSRDDGETWQKLDIGIPIAPNSRICLSTEVLPNGKTSVFVGYDAGASKLLMRLSEDDGATWVEIPKSNIPAATSSIFDVFLSPNSDKMFVAVAYNMGLFRSTNRGVSWRRIDNADSPTGESNDLFLTFASDTGGRIFVGRNALETSSKSKNACVWRSSDDGESWTSLTNGWDNRDITNNKVTGISMGWNTDVWAITEKTSGVFFSSDGGDSWVSRNEGLPGDASGRGITVTSKTHAFVGQAGGFVHRHLYTSSVNETQTIIRSASVYPNPTAEMVNVEFDLIDQSNVRIDLYTIAGSAVVEPLQRALTAGKHSAALDVSTVPSGVYLCRVSSGTSIWTGTITVVH